MGERSLVPMGKIEHVVKEILAKLVGDTASFLQFLGIQKYLFWRKCIIIAWWRLEIIISWWRLEIIVVIVRSFDHCLASESGRCSQVVSSLWCGRSAPTCLDGILMQVFGRLV